MDQLPYEILVEIFKRIRRPISFGLTNKLLLKVFTDPDNDLRKRLEKLWAADLPIEVYGELLHEGNQYRENTFLKVLKHYEIGENPDKIVYQSDENLESLKLFSFDLNIYQWILEKFGTSSTVTSKCLEEIVSTKTYFVNLNNSGNNNSNRNRNNNLSPSTSFSSSEPIRSITLPTCVQASFDGVYEHYCNFYQLNRLMH
ncbi:5475_t:CDS:2 [Entrophospora sp. SA101]|nr:5475_t:CDS:2 [Entrophospora sp. SA101]